MDTLVTIHSLYRWLVLVALVAGGAAGIIANARGRDWDGSADRPYALVAVLVDIQVGLGIVLWLFDRAWEKGVFFAAIHPVTMLLAVGVVHAAVARARKMASQRSHLVAGIGTLVALALVIAGIPWGR